MTGLHRPVCLLGLCLLACGEARPDALSEGDRLQLEGNHTAAIRQYESALADLDASDREQRTELLLRCARAAHYGLGDEDRALRFYRQAIAAGPELPTTVLARRAISAMLEKRGDLRGAARELDALLRDDSESEEQLKIRLELAQLLARDGRDDEAIRVLEHIRDGSGKLADRVEGLLFMAALLDLNDRGDEALAVYEYLLSQPHPAPTESRIRFELAGRLEGRGQILSAKENYTLAKFGAEDPDLIDARLRRLNERRPWLLGPATRYERP